MGHARRLTDERYLPAWGPALPPPWPGPTILRRRQVRTAAFAQRSGSMRSGDAAGRTPGTVPWRCCAWGPAWSWISGSEPVTSVRRALAGQVGPPTTTRTGTECGRVRMPLAGHGSIVTGMDDVSYMLQVHDTSSADGSLVARAWLGNAADRCQEEGNHCYAQDRQHDSPRSPVARRTVESARVRPGARTRRGQPDRAARGGALGAVGAEQPALAIPGHPPRRGSPRPASRLWLPATRRGPGRPAR